MSTAAEPVSASHDADATRQHNGATATLVQEPAIEQDHAIAGRLSSGTPAEPPGEGTTRILRHPSLSHSANTAVRAIALKRAQQHYGNQFVQRAIAGIHRSPSRTSLIQRQCACGGTCAKCSASSTNTVQNGSPFLVQAQATDSTGLREPETVSPDIVPQQSNGHPLDNQTRGFMESRFGEEFSQVRVHTDTPAAESAKALNADAYTTGQDIYFAEGKYSPQTQEGQHLLAHELAHTVQQGESAPPSEVAAKQHDGVVVGRPDDPLEAEADEAAHTVMSQQPANVALSSDSQSQPIRRGWRDKVSAAWDATGGRAVGAAKEGAEAIVRHFSPELADLIAQGPMPFVKGLLHKALTQWLPSLGGGNLVTTAQDFVKGLGSAFTLLSGVAKGDAKSCQAFGEILDSIRNSVLKVLDSPAVNRLKETAEEVNKTLTKLVNTVLAPQFEMLSEILGGAWQVIKGAAAKVSGWMKKAKNAVGNAWDWVLEKLGFNGPEDENGVWAWIKRHATQVWDDLKKTFSPVVDSLKTAGKVILAFSGLGLIYALVKYGPKVVDAVTWLWEHRNDPDIVRSAHKEMGNTILPKLLEGVGGFRDTLKSAASWFKEKITSLGTAVLSLLGDITGIPILSIAKGLIQKISDGVQGLVTWAEAGFQDAVKWVTSIVQKIGNFVAPYKEILSSLALAIVNPAMIPIIIAGWAWQAVPKCIKVPIINFLLDIVLSVLQALPDLPMFGPLWSLLKPGIVAFLRRIRTKATDAEKEQISIKIAKIVRGSSLDFIFGFVKGLLLGVWEGITDPIKAIWLVMEGLTWVMDYLDGLTTAAFGRGKTPKPASSSGNADTAVLENQRQPAQTGPQTTIGEKPTSASTSSIRTQSTTQPTAAASISSIRTGSPTQPTPASAESPAPAAPQSDPGLGESVQALAGELRPDVEKVLADFWSAAGEYFSGGEGVTYAQLAEKFGEAWGAIQGKIKEMGSDLADKFTAFFSSGGEADAKLGEGMGWLVGTVAFQVVVDILSAGTWAAAGPVVKAIAKFINWPMEFMGEAFKLLGKLGGYLIDGVKSLGKMVKEAGGGALKVVSEAIGSIGTKLMSFAERLLGKASGAAAREGTHLAEREALALGEKEAAKVAEREAAQLAEKEAGKVAEQEGTKLAEKEGAEAAEKKGVQEAEQKGSEKAEGQAAKEAAEKPAALEAARAISEVNDQLDTPVPILIAELMTLKSRFSWIKSFQAKPKGVPGHYSVHMIASDSEVDPDYTTGSKPPKGTLEGDQWRYQRYRDEGGQLDYDEWFKRSRGGRKGGPGHQQIQQSLIEGPGVPSGAKPEVQVGDRFADAFWPKGPNGKPVYHQIGGLNPGRLDPIARERRAIQNIREIVGKDVDIWFWNKENPAAAPLKNPDLLPSWKLLGD